jgi:hypothetical protein
VGLTEAAIKTTETPSEWIEKHFYVPDPRDPLTGERLPAGPLRLAPHQRKIIDAALEKDENGNFKYATIVYSAPKKSGKSAITSAVILFMAYHNPNSYLACVANDGKQSADRLYMPIYTCFRLHREMGGIFKDVKPKLESVVLPNFSKIEAVNVDAAGEAGSQPLMVSLSELWGFTTEKKRRMFVEMSIPATLYGKAIRWIETYAGYKGQSELLEQIYTTGFINGEPHPDFLDLVGRDGPVVKINKAASIFVYWDTEPRMVWQNHEFYVAEAAILAPTEFRRIHRNEWVSSMDSYIQSSWWDACEDEALPILTNKDTPVVVGIDMAVTGDCAALVAVSRHPFFPDTKIAVRAVRIFNPALTSGIINQELLIRPVIEDWYRRFNVLCWVYDPHEMAKLVQDMLREGYGWFKAFGQQQPRAIADKHLYDMIVNRQVAWNRLTTEGDVGFRGAPGETLYKHLTQAGAKIAGDAYRLEKLTANAHIDGAVAASQAAFQVMKLVLSNNEFDEKHLIRKLQYGEITPDEFSKQMQATHPELVARAFQEYLQKGGKLNG